jgi:hypothetical protein
MAEYMDDAAGAQGATGLEADAVGYDTSPVEQ